MSWANQYVGIPYMEKGRTRAALDCWGLVRLVLKDQAGLEFPSWSEDYDDLPMGDIPGIEGGLSTRGDLVRSKLAQFKWSEVEADDLEALDTIIFRVLGQPSHIAIVVRPTLMLHSHFSVGSCVIEDYSDAKWMTRIVKCYRPNPATSL